MQNHVRIHGPGFKAGDVHALRSFIAAQPVLGLRKQFCDSLRWKTSNASALFQAHLANARSVVNCSIEPSDFEASLANLFPHVLCQRADSLALDSLGRFDAVVCTNVIEHLPADQRCAFVEKLAQKLSPGGLLALTADLYFDNYWENPAFVSAGLQRKESVPAGWARFAPEDLLELGRSYGLQLIAAEPAQGDPTGEGLLRHKRPPFPHAPVAALFQKSSVPDMAGKRIVLGLLTWNTREISTDSVRAHVREAHRLARLGHQPYICVVDNGSIDGTSERLRWLELEIDFPHKLVLNDENLGNSAGRNQIIDYSRECDADYVLLMDGDIEIVPFSSFAMLSQMENRGRAVGCVGADSATYTAHRAAASPYLLKIAAADIDTVKNIAWTQYGMFRRDVFDDGIRFDQTGPFAGPGWGFEDNDLAFQMQEKGYLSQRFFGLTYLHRNVNSSIGIMRKLGIDSTTLTRRRRQYTLDKWSGVPAIADGPLIDVARVPID